MLIINENSCNIIHIYAYCFIDTYDLQESDGITFVSPVVGQHNLPVVALKVSYLQGKEDLRHCLLIHLTGIMDTYQCTMIVLPVQQFWWQDCRVWYQPRRFSWLHWSHPWCSLKDLDPCSTTRTFISCIFRFSQRNKLCVYKVKYSARQLKYTLNINFIYSFKVILYSYLILKKMNERITDWQERKASVIKNAFVCIY